MRTAYYLVALTTVWTAMPSLASEFGAIDTLRRYSAAFMSYDCDAQFALISPYFIAHDRRPNETHDALCNAQPRLRREIIVETLDPPKATLSDGPRIIVVVPAHRELGRVPFRYVVDFDYVVHSRDGGRTWKVLDSTCNNTVLVREAYPAYAGDPPIQTANVRRLTGIFK